MKRSSDLHIPPLKLFVDLRNPTRYTGFVIPPQARTSDAQDDFFLRKLQAPEFRCTFHFLLFFQLLPLVKKTKIPQKDFPFP